MSRIKIVKREHRMDSEVTVAEYFRLSVEKGLDSYVFAKEFLTKPYTSIMLLDDFSTSYKSPEKNIQ